MIHPTVNPLRRSRKITEAFLPVSRSPIICLHRPHRSVGCQRADFPIMSRWGRIHGRARLPCEHFRQEDPAPSGQAMADAADGGFMAACLRPGCQMRCGLSGACHLAPPPARAVSAITASTTANSAAPVAIRAICQPGMAPTTAVCAGGLVDRLVDVPGRQRRGPARRLSPGGDVASWSRGRDGPRTRLARSWRTPAGQRPARPARRRDGGCGRLPPVGIGGGPGVCGRLTLPSPR
jgi:hypothetical protein